MVSVMTRRSSAWRRERSPADGGVGDQHVALPLHGREHQAEQGGEHHERLEREHLARHVADLTERVAVGDHDQAEGDEGGGRALQRGQRDRQPQPAPDQHGEGEERQRDGAPGSEDQPEHRERDAAARAPPRRGAGGAPARPRPAWRARCLR